MMHLEKMKAKYMKAKYISQFHYELPSSQIIIRDFK